MSRKIPFYFFLLFLTAGLLATSCSKSDDQRRFEERAQADPQGITQTDGTGDRSGAADPDDWQIAPMFGGLVEIETPAYPNPVALNSHLRIDVYVSGLETLDRIEVYAFEFPGQLYGPLSVTEGASSTSLFTINLNAESIASSSGGSGASGVYRLLLYDGRENLISYGDVRVQ